jgi:hypothetical protein
VCAGDAQNLKQPFASSQSDIIYNADVHVREGVVAKGIAEKAKEEIK